MSFFCFWFPATKDNIILRGKKIKLSGLCEFFFNNLVGFFSMLWLWNIKNIEVKKCFMELSTVYKKLIFRYFWDAVGSLRSFFLSSPISINLDVTLWGPYDISLLLWRCIFMVYCFIPQSRNFFKKISNWYEIDNILNPHWYQNDSNWY